MSIVARLVPAVKGGADAEGLPRIPFCSYTLRAELAEFRDVRDKIIDLLGWRGDENGVTTTRNVAHGELLLLLKSFRSQAAPEENP